jgi:hypothetical protein
MPERLAFCVQLVVPARGSTVQEACRNVSTAVANVKWLPSGTAATMSPACKGCHCDESEHRKEKHDGARRWDEQ